MGGAGTLRPRGAAFFSSFARSRSRSFVNRLLDDDEGRAASGESLAYGCVDDRWLVREDSFFTGASGMRH